MYLIISLKPCLTFDLQILTELFYMALLTTCQVTYQVRTHTKKDLFILAKGRS